MKTSFAVVCGLVAVLASGCSVGFGIGGTGSSGFVLSTETKVGTYHDKAEDGQDAQSDFSGSLDVVLPFDPFEAEDVE